MLSVAPTTRVFLGAEPVDMRKCYDALAAVVRDRIGEDPLSGHLFVFTNKRRNRVKILAWDGSGLWVMAKRLEKGTFAWPTLAPETKSVTLSAAQLTLILHGLDLRSARERRWWRRPAAPTQPA